MAFGVGTFNAAGGAVDDLFAAKGLRMKAEGQVMEALRYGEAAAFADKNARFTETSTAIKDVQLQRKGYLALGSIEADVAGSGFTEGGSAMDILRDSAAQASLERSVAGYQGLIAEEGYQQQADSYRSMAAASQLAAKASRDAANAKEISAGIKGATAVFSLFTPPGAGDITKAIPLPFG